MKKKQKPVAETLVIRDGDGASPVVDVMLDWLLQHAFLAKSDDPRIRAVGLKELRKAAAALVAHRWAVAGGARGGRPKGITKPDDKPDGKPNISARTARRRRP